LLAQGLGPVGLGDLGIEAADVLLQLAVELEIALAHVLQLAHHPGQPLAGVLQLIHHDGEKIDGPGGHQQAEEDRAHQVDDVHGAAQKQGHPIWIETASTMMAVARNMLKRTSPSLVIRST
jgi:hypothetical protein